MSPQLYQDTIQSVPPWHSLLQFWASNTASSGVALPSNLKLLFYESALLTLICFRSLVKCYALSAPSLDHPSKMAEPYAHPLWSLFPFPVLFFLKTFIIHLTYYIF